MAQDDNMAETSVGKLMAEDALAEALGQAGSLNSPEDSLNRAIIRCCKRTGAFRFRRSPPR